VEIVEINIDRLTHLLSLFRLKKEEVLSILNEGRKKLLTESDVFSESIKLSILKKIDGIFDKGIPYYISPFPVRKDKEESIFFRKEDFNVDLNLEAKKVVNRFEQEKIAFSAITKLADFKLKRTLPIYKLIDNPKKVANEVRQYLYPELQSSSRDFLKALITKASEHNILVFEFIETHNKKHKANIEGFYLSPNVIVLKRNQKSYKREIFTLVHELGHYLLNDEEIDAISEEPIKSKEAQSTTERWCNDFAYCFLVGDMDRIMTSMPEITAGNDYMTGLIEDISKKTYLSTLSLYTNLYLNGKMTFKAYDTIRQHIVAGIKEYEEEKKRQNEEKRLKDEAAGKKTIIPPPKPIISPLYLRTMQNALFVGVINEMEFCKKLSIKADKLQSYLQ